jgi:hypothetical protein
MNAVHMPEANKRWQRRQQGTAAAPRTGLEETLAVAFGAISESACTHKTQAPHTFEKGPVSFIASVPPLAREGR